MSSAHRFQGRVARATLGLLVGVLWSLPAHAVQPVGYAVGGGAVLERYVFAEPEVAGIDAISLFTAPVAGRADLAGGRLRVEVNGAYARGTLKQSNGTETSLAGFTDTELRVAVPFGVDAVVVTAIAMLPTGVASLSADESVLAGVIAADLLPFRISNWGSGGGFGGSTAVARRVGATGLGLAVGYLVGREFEPVDDETFRYRPGSQLRVQAAVDRTMGRSVKASLQAAYQRFGDDEANGENLYRSGDRYQALGSVAFVAGPRANGIVYAGFAHRERGSFPGTGAPDSGDVEGTPSQGLVLLGGALRVPAAGGVVLPGVDARIFRRSDGIGQGFTVGVGGQAEWPIGGATFIPTLRGRFGRVLMDEDVESGFTGVEIGATVRFGRAGG